MYSLPIVLLLSTSGVFVCAEGPLHHFESHVSKRGMFSRFEEDEPPQPHPFEMDSCGGHFTRSHGKVNMDSKCTDPVDTMVPLIPPSEDIEYTPSKVRVKRCQGMCITLQECVPIKSHNKKLSVRQRNLRTDEQSCGTVTVEEHSLCKCGCRLMKKHCNPKLQMYDAEQCMCKCMDPKVKQRCQSQGFRWDDKNCSCTCESDRDCNIDEVWDPEECMCAPEDEDSTNDIKK